MSRPSIRKTVLALRGLELKPTAAFFIPAGPNRKIRDPHIDLWFTGNLFYDSGEVVWTDDGGVHDRFINANRMFISMPADYGYADHAQTFYDRCKCTRDKLVPYYVVELVWQLVLSTGA
jgi:hypothetical protein